MFVVFYLINEKQIIKMNISLFKLSFWFQEEEF